MEILLVSATEFEINQFVLSGLKQLHKDIPADILITGVGAPAAIFHITKALSAKKYDLVIQAGIAGAFNKKYKLGDVVLISKDRFADVGIYESNKFISIFETSFEDGNAFPYEDGFLMNNMDLKKFQLPAASAITINTITDNKKTIKQWLEKFDADIESMEGAALHYVCLQMNIPFLQIRSISNKVGERDKTKWKMEKAISNLNTELLRIFKLIIQ